MNERAQSIKGLPLNELSITGIACIVDVYENDDGRAVPVVEMEVLNEADWAVFNAPKDEANRCALCGHGLKIACAVTHKPTANGYWIGRDCAAKVKELASFGPLIKNATVALAQRIACDKREADFLAAHPDALGILKWAKSQRGKICQDMCEKLRRFGNLSDKQIALLEKIRQQDIDRRSKATGTAKAGRQVITGKVLKVQVFDSEFTRGKKDCRILVDLGNGVRLMGNTPEYIDATEINISRGHQWTKIGHQLETCDAVKVGDSVTFKATVEPSKADNLFGFWKRPASFQITALTQAPALAQAPAQALN